MLRSSVKPALAGVRPFRVPAGQRCTQRRASAPAATTAEMEQWVKDDERRMLHAVYRVGDMDATIEYYKKALGMQLLRYRDIPDEKYTNAFLGYGSERSHFALELTKNYGVDSYDIGDGFGHFGLAVPDVRTTVEQVKAANGKVTRDAGPVSGGSSMIAFVEDPTGYKFELIERPGAGDPLCQVMLRVSDLEASIRYYTECIGMTLLRKRENPENRYTLAFLGYGPEDSGCVFELTHNWDRTEEYSRGNAYAQVALSTGDVYKTAAAIIAKGGKITREPGPLPGLNTKIMASTDPDGWKIVFVDAQDFEKELVDANAP